MSDPTGIEVALLNLVLQFVLVRNVLPGGQKHLSLCKTNIWLVKFSPTCLSESATVTTQLTHFSILNKKYVEWDENAEVKDVDVVFHSHLQGSA